MNEFDIIVIGGGILGIAHAYHCLQAGLKVALIERDAYPNGATVRNFGQVVPSGMDLKWQQYGRESLTVYKEIQSKADISVKQEGSIYLASNSEEAQLLEELASINQENNYRSELWTKEQCLDHYPGLRQTYVKAGLFFPEEIKLDPRVAARRIIEYCVAELGLNYFSRRTIIDIASLPGQQLLTDNLGRTYRCKKTFLCGGTEFQLLFPDIFNQSDLVRVKLQMMETVPQKKQIIPGSVLSGWTIRRYESFHECPSFSAIKAQEDADAYHLKLGIHILFKQSPDGGVIIGDSHEYASVKEGEPFSLGTDNEINCFILSQAQRIFQLEDWQISRTWVGEYSQCQEQDIFNETIEQDIHIVTGIGGKGMTGALGYAKENVHNLLSLNLETI
ncbi:MAG: TIGR03364 family FAD-dependent oxidoreductase [Saprospiraceae bacterium]|nr:TIGR03364 family FAD-dependent oxidoreductase [Saprospiraceae bacterium]